ncbi:LamG-like jellyroll fold domain-containing protein [Anaerobaca lacustris]|uniref:Discoidin domain-containing protein n=1 Tax=Anaerobaca lacustris TaxID=3044600 RepID=A0AAW6TZG1_9BACT|nr:discoidin domain-containing protein [Sedimentisphaerales bacterium M17dextr]
MRVTLSCLILLVLVLAAGNSASAALVGHWRFDEGSGTTARDSSGNGNDGTLSGDVEWAAGQIGNALQFNENGWVDCGDILTLTQTLTITCWVNPAVLSGDRGFVTREAAYAFKSSGNFLRFTTPGILDYNGNNTILQTDTWQHVAVTFMPNQTQGCVFYLNGVETDRVNSTGLNAGTGPFRMGNNQWGQLYSGMIDDVRVFDHILTPEEIVQSMYGTGPELASDPQPEDEATDVPRDVVLSWAAGEFAATHDVYFGASFDDVNAASRANPMGVLASQGQVATAYDPAGLLDFETTYYWRVDEVNAAPDNTIFTGNVWSFTTEPFAYAVEAITATSNGISDAGVGPERTVDGSGLNALDQHSTLSDDMWVARAPADEALYIQYEFDRVYKLHQLLVWNYNVQFELMLGFGIQDVTVEYSADSVEWMSLGDVQLNRATASATYTYNTTVDLQGVAAQYVRLTVNSGFGMLGQFGLSEVRFTYIPAQAREPQPADGAVDVDVNASLSWRAGRDAASHDVYFGTSVDELSLAATSDQAVFTPAAMGFGTTYYWRVDEVSDETWAGETWSFTTQEYAWIDDFESYTDDIDAGEAIFDTWLDGWVNNTGSTVGYLETPFAERSIVHGGKQSMPLAYDNTTSPFYSEAVRAWDAPQDWTGNGADTLRLFVAGRAPAFAEAADGTILMNAIGNDIWGNADQFRYVYKNLSGNGSVTARVDMLDISPDIWVKAGVMIRQNAEAGGINVFMAMTGTGGGGSTFQQRMTAGGASVSQHTYPDGPFTAPYWVRVTREGNTLRGYTSPDGENWTQRGDTITLAMTDPVLIGLALTSHNVNQATSAQFSNVAFTGNVTGAWQVAEVGVAQPEGNAVAPLYVALEDATGRSAVVTHPDANIVGRSGWNEWQIPLSEFGGVNLSQVDTMTIGVGNRTSPTAGGTGLLYIDDVGFGSPAGDVTEVAP